VDTHGMAYIFRKWYIYVEPKISVYSLFTLTVAPDRVKPYVIRSFTVRPVVKWNDIFSRLIISNFVRQTLSYLMQNCVIFFLKISRLIPFIWLSSRREGSCVREETHRAAKYVQYGISCVLQDSYCHEHYDIVGSIFLF